MSNRSRILSSVFASAVCLALLPGVAAANNGKSDGHSNSHASSSSTASSKANSHANAKASSASSASQAGKDKTAPKPSKTEASADEPEVIEVKGNNGNGAVASELKGMNSSHASEVALEHAAPNSAVGKNATYVSATRAAAEAEGTKAEAEAQLALAATDLQDAKDAVTAAELELEAANLALQTAIDNGEDTTEAQALVDAATTKLNEAMAAAEAAQLVYDAAEDTATEAAGLYDAAAAAEYEALMAASGGRELSDAALAEYRANLGL